MVTDGFIDLLIVDFRVKRSKIKVTASGGVTVNASPVKFHLLGV